MSNSDNTFPFQEMKWPWLKSTIPQKSKFKMIFFRLSRTNFQIDFSHFETTDQNTVSGTHRKGGAERRTRVRLCCAFLCASPILMIRQVGKPVFFLSLPNHEPRVGTNELHRGTRKSGRTEGATLQ